MVRKGICMALGDSELLVVGKRLPREDGFEKVTGRARFTGDISLPGMLYGAIVPSPLPKGRIVSIDPSAALELPGVRAVITYDDLVDPNGPIRCQATTWGPILRDQPILAPGEVRYVGEPVAAVVADNPRTAREAARLVEVDIEPEPAVTDLAEAMEPGAPLVHREQPELSPGVYRTSLVPEFGKSNIVMTYEIAEGDVEAAFAAADRVFEDEFTFPSTFHYAMEPHCAIALAERGHLTVWSSQQHPSQVQRELGRLFGYPTGHVRVIATYVGGGFGGKTWPHIEPLATALSKAVGAPVKVELDVAQSVLVSRRHEAMSRVRSALDASGNIIAYTVDIYLDAGAYAAMGPLVIQKAAHRALGAYAFPAYRARAYMVYTNRSPSGSARAIGGPQGAWGLEEHLNRVAHATGQDLLTFRARHTAPKGTEIRKGMTPITSDLSYVAERMRALMEAGAEQADGTQQARTEGPAPFGKAAAWRYGRGAAFGVCDPGASPVSTAIVRLAADGSATALVGSSELGQGVRTVIRQIVAETLGLPYERVHVPVTDTGFGPFDASTGASRSTVMAGLAAQRAALDVRERIVAMAAEQWGVPKEEVRIEGGIARGPAGQEKPLGAFVVEYFGGDGAFLGRGEVRSREFPTSPPFWEVAAGGVRIAVDTDTGVVKVLDYYSVCDVGRAINPLAMEGQEEGAIVQGLGHSLSEALIWQYGQLMNASLVDYRVPRFSDAPHRLVTEFVEEGDGPGPFGAKGGGEGAIVPVAGAVAAALFDATGVRVNDLPLTPERVWRALQEAGVGGRRYGRPETDSGEEGA